MAYLTIRLEDSRPGGQSLNVEGVQYEDVMVILGQGHHVALGGDLETAATGNLNVWTLVLRLQLSILGIASHVEAIAV